MKTIYLTKIVAICFLLGAMFTTNAQVSGFAITNIEIPSTTVLHSCDSTLTVGFSAVTPSTSSTGNVDLPYTIHGNNFTGFQFQAQVNWGDGSTSTSGGGTSTSGTPISMNPPLSHYYTSPGIYNVVTTVYNPANQTYGIDTVTYQIGYCSVYFYLFAQLDCNNDGVIDSQLNNVSIPFTITNGNTSYSGSTQNGMINLSSVLAGMYTIQIDPTWLATNNYVVNNMVPNNQLYVGYSGAVTYAVTLNCGSAVQQGCLHGHVYCDSNGNGIWDSNEATIANAPVQINGNTFYTNANGEYNLTYLGSSGNGYPININSSWAQQHGYTIPANSPDSVYFNLCTPGTTSPILNFPINCGSSVTPTPTMCYSGYVFCDANGNGVMNTNEAPIAGAPVMLYNTTATNSSITVYTDSTGYFSYCGQFSTSTYLIATLSQSWLSYNGYNPTVGVITLVGNPTGTTNVGYFAVNCGGTTTTCADLWTTVTPWIGYYQNSTAYIKLNWGNYGPGAAGNYTLTMSFPAGVTVNTSSIANSGYTLSGNTISWNLSSASTFFSNYDVITFNVPGGLSSGTAHYFTSTIAPTSGTDCSTYNNAGNLLQLVGNSYDPNEKVVARPESTIQHFGTPTSSLDGTTQEALTYTIRFQNTGTAPAQNIYIIDTLDADLDWSSLTLVEATHNMQIVNLGNGVIRFEFPNIWLADSTTNEAESHGHLVYRIMESTSAHAGTEIENTAYIYFDWNTPIVTNTTYNINVIVIGGVEENGAAIAMVYPNPTTESLTISYDGKFDYQLVDLSGRIISSGSGSDVETISISSAAVGIYQLTVNGSKGNSSLKVIKQ